MLKSFEELRQVDVAPYCKERDGMLYLPWAKCVDLLHENGAKDVYWLPLTDENGSSLLMSNQVFTDKYGTGNRCYEVRVHIKIDDLEFDVQTPVMNGSNPVKDNSMSQQRVWNAQTRAFVKGVALRTGLGFGLWSESEEDKITDDDLSRHNIFAIRERVQQTITAKMQQHGCNTDEFAKKLGLSKRQVETWLGYYDKLNNFEKAIQKI